ncbi:hypothetical protein F2P81_001206 [Scophthalmus maximus]|uniref:Thrombospondin-like N-terminal domain-containing protein n=1 Tax=Scophthalmus maximus TaxID=52904 RepID=A0A6A4TN17_SCOMX|nr:hypothetical protein F2P81_001206 [Scophthalmus maximus]
MMEDERCHVTWVATTIILYTSPEGNNRGVRRCRRAPPSLWLSSPSSSLRHSDVSHPQCDAQARTRNQCSMRTANHFMRDERNSFQMRCALAAHELDLNRLDGDTVCPPMRSGQDDLPGFDLITQFQLDVIPLKGVRKVDGSTPLQVAYRLDREANFQIPTMLNFPRGFPDEYSFMVTFRMIKNTVNKVWNVWQIVDEDGNKQAGMRLNGDQQALEYFLMGADGNLQTVVFPGLSVLFNTKWHKVMIGVERDQVTLYVDCQPVDRKPIKGKGPVNTEGDTLIGRLDADPDASVVHDILTSVTVNSPTNQSKAPQEPLAQRAREGQQEKTAEMEETVFQASLDPQVLLYTKMLIEFFVALRVTKVWLVSLEKMERLERRERLEQQVLTGHQVTWEMMVKEGPLDSREALERRETEYENDALILIRELWDRRESRDPQGTKEKLESLAQTAWMDSLELMALRACQGSRESSDPLVKSCFEASQTHPDSFVSKQGEPGNDGEDGKPGDKGATGVTGKQGPLGPTGPPGIQGDKGDKGDTGAKGLKGHTGLKGDQGPVGPMGPKGSLGPKVSDDKLREMCSAVVEEQLAEFRKELLQKPAALGAPGTPGPAGPPGPTGPAGAAGAAGAPGLTGPKGHPGYFGLPGIQGKKGDAGEKGDKGNKGEDGIGVKGSPGAPGAQGAPGAPGIGQDGKNGERGDAGSPGVPGTSGPRGPSGPPGLCDPSTCISRLPPLYMVSGKKSASYKNP